MTYLNEQIFQLYNPSKNTVFSKQINNLMNNMANTSKYC